VCPADLQPQDLYWFAKSKNFGKAQEFSLFDCIECGACSYVCPSSIPLVQYYRFAKSEIWANEREKEAANLARERHEFHLMRIERDKQERPKAGAKKRALRLAVRRPIRHRYSRYRHLTRPGPRDCSPRCRTE
jgi:electron transport complex protein RnfC